MSLLYFGEQLNCWPKNNPCYLYLATERDRDRETDREEDRGGKKGFLQWQCISICVCFYLSTTFARNFPS